jgi:drug/metabolite transporter (DMT)-like permease
MSLSAVAPVLVWLFLCLVWGSTWIFIKLGLRDLPPISFAGIRFVIAASALLLYAAVLRIPLPRGREQWRFLAVSGLLSFTINYGTLFWGEQYVSSGLAALLQATIPLFGLLVAHVYLPQERISAVKVAGVLLGLAGVGIIFSDQMSAGGPQAFWGSAAIVLGAASVAWGNVLVKARGMAIPPATLAAGQMLCGLVPLVVAGFVLEGAPWSFRWTPLAWVCLLYLALVGSALAFLLYYWLLRHMAVTSMMLIALVTPVTAVLIGAAVLDEAVSGRLAAGGAAILAGVGLIVLRRRR